MIRRRTLTPPASQAVPGLHATRRRSARLESSERVSFFLVDGRELDGWTLNQSPGGIRAVLEEPVELGAHFEVSVGGRDRRPGRIVWIQDEPDGAIVGVAYLDTIEDPPSEPVQDRESVVGSHENEGEEGDEGDEGEEGEEGDEGKAVPALQAVPTDGLSVEPEPSQS